MQPETPGGHCNLEKFSVPFIKLSVEAIMKGIFYLFPMVGVEPGQVVRWAMETYTRGIEINRASILLETMN